MAAARGGRCPSTLPLGRAGQCGTVSLLSGLWFFCVYSGMMVTLASPGVHLVSDSYLVGASVVTAGVIAHPSFSKLGGLGGELLHRRLSRGHCLAAPELVPGGCSLSRLPSWAAAAPGRPRAADGRSWSCRQLSPVDRLLVLRLLVGQVPGKSRALKANGSEFTSLFYCVTLGRLLK